MAGEIVIYGPAIVYATIAMLLLGPVAGAISLPKANLHKPRGTEGHNDRQESQIKDSKESIQVYNLPKAVSGEPPALCLA